MSYMDFVIALVAVWFILNIVYRIIVKQRTLKSMSIDLKYGLLLVARKQFRGKPREPGKVAFFAIGILLYGIAFIVSTYVLVSMIYRGMTTGAREVVVLVPGLNITGWDLLYFMLAVLIGISIHEYFHAKTALKAGISIKNYGIIVAFIILGAFVEIDEEQFEKARKLFKVAVLSMGIAGNLVLWYLSVNIINYTTSPTGLTVIGIEQGSLAERSGVQVHDVLYRINGTDITLDSLRFYLTTNETTLLVFEVFRPGIGYLNIPILKNASDSKLGVYLTLAPSRNVVNVIHPSVFLVLFKTNYWLYVVNLSLMFINTLPLFITDGGRIIREVFGEKVSNIISTVVFMTLVLALIINARI